MIVADDLAMSDETSWDREHAVNCWAERPGVKIPTWNRSGLCPYHESVLASNVRVRHSVADTALEAAPRAHGPLQASPVDHPGHPAREDVPASGMLQAR